MKKIIFLVLLFVFDLFSYSNTVVKVLDGQRKTANLQTPIPPNPAPTTNTAGGCANSIWPGNGNNIYSFCTHDSVDDPNTCTQSIRYIPNGQNDYGYFYREELTTSITCACIPPSGGCPSGQVLNEQTCQCECAPTDFNIIIDELTTPETCTVTQANMLLPDGGVNYISEVEWDSCRSECRGKASTCPCNQHIFNGACVDVVPTDGSCNPGYIFKNECSISDGGSSNTGPCPGCIVSFFNSGDLIACYAASAGCCTGNTATNDGDGDGKPDTPPSDTNTTNPGGPGENGGEDGEEDGGETGGGDSNTSTPAPGDSNTSTPAPGDSNTSVMVDRALLDEEGFEEALSNAENFVEDVKEQFDTFKENVENHFSDIEEKYNSTKSLFMNGTPPIMSSGGSLDCASFTFNGKTIHLDLSKVSIIQPVVYYIFTAFFMFLNFVFLVNHLFRGLD